MNTRYQGFALIVSAVVFLVTTFVDLPDFVMPLAQLLFIYGIAGLHPIQSKGSTLGLVGIGLIILAAVIALGFSVGLVNVGDSNSGMLISTSAYAGLIGRVITGWLTINKKSFPAWVGVALIADGVLNVIPFGSLASVMNIVSTLAGTAALLGYGVPMSQKK